MDICRGRGAYGRLVHVNVIDGDDYHTASVPVPDRIAGSRSRPKGQAGGGDGRDGRDDNVICGSLLWSWSPGPSLPNVPTPPRATHGWRCRRRVS